MDNKTAISPYNHLREIQQMFALPDTIIIYDSTLRDGEQMPYISFTPEQKITIAHKLEDIGIPEIEAGFPAISKREQHTVKEIVASTHQAKILVLSRLKQEDIDAARQTDADLLLLFIATSPLHLKYKLHTTEKNLLQKIESCLQYAHDHGIIPSFSTEDSTRTPLPLLKKIYHIAEDIGVQRLGITDTVGCATPETIKYLFTQIRQITTTPLSAHLHNDFGLALINALTALHAGATHICTTINGIGERAGNVSLEQLVMALTFLYQKNLGIDTTQFTALSNLIASFTNYSPSRQSPFTGDNTYSHESGIHVAAILENPQTYEPIPPELVGNKRKLILGKHTGRHTIKHLLKNYDIPQEDAFVQKLTEAVKRLGETNTRITEEKLNTLIKHLR